MDWNRYYIGEMISYANSIKWQHSIITNKYIATQIVRLHKLYKYRGGSKSIKNILGNRLYEDYLKARKI